MTLPNQIQDKTLRRIAEKVMKDIPVSREDALCLLKTQSILDMGAIAHHVRTQLHNDTTYYGVNMNLNYTNICEHRCPLCAFSCDESDKEAFLLSLAAVEQRVKRAVDWGIDEIHIVGGLNPNLTIDYFEEMFKRIKAVKPDLYIVALTAVEYDYIAKRGRG